MDSFSFYFFFVCFVIRFSFAIIVIRVNRMNAGPIYLVLRVRRASPRLIISVRVTAVEAANHDRPPAGLPTIFRFMAFFVFIFFLVFFVLHLYVFFLHD